VLLFFPVLYCKFFESMDIISSCLFVLVYHISILVQLWAMTYKFGKELKLEEITWYSINAMNIMFSLLVIL